MNSSSVYVFDDLNPEDNAMVQALYSRSPDSVVHHRDKVADTGSGKFMDQFYVGYGHASIGDCGSTTIFIENVSMLVAKAIQDNPLYSGQEASTRYLDFSKQSQYDPYGIPESRFILDKWMELYNKYMPIAIEGLKERHPYDPNDGRSEKVWLKAIEVRAFDTLRSLLPVGTTTLLSWHTNLRQARDHLRYLFSHPLKEVQDVAHQIYSELIVKYPNSFHVADTDVYSEKNKERYLYAQLKAVPNHYLAPENVLVEMNGLEARDLLDGKVVVRSEPSERNIARIRDDVAIEDRPRGSLLPRRLSSYGEYELSFLLDFGSFRDLQRHRNGYCPVPIVGNEIGFHAAYLVELERILSSEDYNDLHSEIHLQLTRIDDLGKLVAKDSLTDQYLYPMGMACICTTVYDTPQMVYVAELRSGKTVHFSLRPIAQEMGSIVSYNVPALNLYTDYDDDSFTSKRGEQDIVKTS